MSLITQVEYLNFKLYCITDPDFQLKYASDSKCTEMIATRYMIIFYEFCDIHANALQVCR